MSPLSPLDLKGRAFWFCLGFLAGAGMAYWTIPSEAWNAIPLIDWTRTA